MYDNSSLVLAVLTILKNSDKAKSLYELMKILENEGYELSYSKISDSAEIKVFRKNFIVMNALYQLKADLQRVNIFLFVSSLKIKLFSNNNIQDGLLESLDDIETSSALSEYYLDWKNYDSTDEQMVNDLFKNFWQNYNNHVRGSDERENETDKRLDALQLLGLESSASWKDIQQSYRQLVTVYHPDKGGDSLDFIKIREAYLILKLIKS